MDDSTDSFDNSNETQDFIMENMVDVFSEETQIWLSNHGEEILRSQINIYLKTKKLDLTYNLQDASTKTSKPSVKRKEPNIISPTVDLEKK